MSELCIQVNEYENLAVELLKDINVNTAINELLNQIVKKNYMPVEVEEVEFNDELLEALEEAEQIIKDMEEGKIKGYHDIDQMFKDILSENCN